MITAERARLGRLLQRALNKGEGFLFFFFFLTFCLGPFGTIQPIGADGMKARLSVVLFFSRGDES
jgi:hypothetical protein